MKTDTPRTDAAEYHLGFDNVERLNGVVDSGFARQLETELNEARAEIERKDQLIEQMREALCMADGLIDTLILDNTLSPSINAERMNIRAAIEAAERKNDDNQKL